MFAGRVRVLVRASICQRAELGEGDPKGLTEEARAAGRAAETLERMSTPSSPANTLSSRYRDGDAGAKELSTLTLPANTLDLDVGLAAGEPKGRYSSSSSNSSSFSGIGRSTSSTNAIGAESPARKPHFRIRV